MSKKKKTLVAAFVVLGVVALGMGAFVYAKYVSTVTGTGTAQVAKWVFSTKNENKQLTCNVTSTVKAGTLVNGKIAPGTSGTCTFELSNKEGDVAVQYSMTKSDSSTAPANLVLTNDGAASGTIAPDSTATVTIEWEWPYYTNNADDVEDTADGVAANGMNLVFNITGTQVDPRTN